MPECTRTGNGGDEERLRLREGTEDMKEQLCVATSRDVTRGTNYKQVKSYPSREVGKIQSPIHYIY